MTPLKITIESQRLSTTVAVGRILADSSLPTISWDGEPDRRRPRRVDQVWNQQELVALIVDAYAHIRVLEAQVATFETAARLRAA